MVEYLLEIGTEELPAHFIAEALAELKSLLVEALTKLQMSFGDVTVLGTPRRLAVIVKGLESVQKTVTKKIKGPPVKSGFDETGKPTAAAAGFAKKQGLALDKLDCEVIEGIEYLVANVSVEGRSTADVLCEVIPQLVGRISSIRPMRWTNSDFKFVRPIRWLVSMLDDEVVPVEINAVKASNYSRGHRILAPGLVTIKSSASYVDDLRSAKVMVDPSERYQTIQQAVSKIATKIGGVAKQLDGDLILEVMHLNEWPAAVLGDFAHEYLELPDYLIETVMIHHQRYFPVQANDKCGQLLPHFISIANNDLPKAYQQIKQGNERVLRARLADARFFYFDDQKTPLSSRQAALQQLTFQEGLGTYADKQLRMIDCAQALTKNLSLDRQTANSLTRVLALCKLDLVTNLVRELPELQGYVGAWYAQQQNELPDVVAAIASHYCPRFNEDKIPADIVGCLAALVDKLDNLVSFFALGKRPTGSSDPFALRRQAQGLIDILVDGLSQYSIDIFGLATLLLNRLTPFLLQLNGKTDGELGLKDLCEFLNQRIRLKLAQMNFAREVIEAAMAIKDNIGDLPDVLARCQALLSLINDSKNVEIIRVGVRVANIVTSESEGLIEEAAFSGEDERKLYEVFQLQVVKPWQQLVKSKLTQVDYQKLLAALACLAQPLDNFFEKVMVNDPDPLLRKNRHALLFDIHQYFCRLGDFTKLQSVLL